MKETYVNNGVEVGFKASPILLSVSDVCCSDAGVPRRSWKPLPQRMIFNEVILCCLQIWGHATLVREQRFQYRCLLWSKRAEDCLFALCGSGVLEPAQTN